MPQEIAVKTLHFRVGFPGSAADSPRADHRAQAGWGPAVAETAINTAYGEGCPIETPDG